MLIIYHLSLSPEVLNRYVFNDEWQVENNTWKIVSDLLKQRTVESYKNMSGVLIKEQATIEDLYG
jgi:hypothetical protein